MNLKNLLQLKKSIDSKAEKEHSHKEYYTKNESDKLYIKYEILQPKNSIQNENK